MISSINKQIPNRDIASMTTSIRMSFFLRPKGKCLRQTKSFIGQE